ncbi:hypothetical protein FQU76_15660 [Streptomyces qinzhouensis]|uniref:Ribbon-helix-helix protein, CopG family n=1 Tax=Streptomyces qinzhouensis TaxID=2599401 RepID=A0A5B8JIT3_9ACTN|nr:hypothetical protein FQU76_15660 [Streptomyces qinzhouensis]
MAKTRISISLDSAHAERIRAHAERAGMDVSAYLVNAATRQMAEVEAAEAQFARLDAVVAGSGLATQPCRGACPCRSHEGVHSSAGP